MPPRRIKLTPKAGTPPPPPPAPARRQARSKCVASNALLSAACLWFVYDHQAVWGNEEGLAGYRIQEVG